MLRDLMAFHNVDVYINAKAERVTGDTVELATVNGKCSVAADTVIISVGYRADSALYEQIRRMGVPVHSVGDSREVKNVMHAVWDAYEVARSL